MNKKGQFFESISIIIRCLCLLALFFGIVLLITYITLNKGNSNDYVYGYEKQAFFGWYKLYLKDDHKTVYCFDDPSMANLLDFAKSENKKVNVNYQEYIFRGFFCMGSEKYDSVVVNSINVES